MTNSKFPFLDSIPEPWIPLREVYVRNGVNINGHANRIYSSGGQWDIHLHLLGSLVRFTDKTDGVQVFLSLLNVDSAVAQLGSSERARLEAQRALEARTAQRQPDTGGLVANQMRHVVSSDDPVAVAPAESLGAEASVRNGSEVVDESISPSSDLSEPDELTPEAKHELDAKKEHFKPAEDLDAAPVKKKRGRPRKHPVLSLGEGSQI